MDNLIIISDNVVDTATLTVSTTAGSTSKDNMKTNIKSQIWRSTATSATILVTFSSRIIQGVATPFCNLTNSATIRVKGWSVNPTLSGISIVGGTMSWDSGSKTACPWDTPLHTTATTPHVGVTSYAFGGGKTGRCYHENSNNITGITIELADPSNPSGYIEISRLVVGDFWSPNYNTSYGLSVEPVDLSTNIRMDSGDLISNIGTKHNKLTFDLKYLTDLDRIQMMKLLKSNGINKPLFVSLFPEDSDPYKERDHQIFGKISQMSPIQHPIYSTYSSQLSVEEI